MVCPTNMTALSGEAALFVQGYECNSSIAPCDFDRVISGYGLTQTALFGDPYCCTAVSARDSFGRQHATCRSMENGVPWHISAAEVVFAIVVAAAPSSLLSVLHTSSQFYTTLSPPDTRFYGFPSYGMACSLDVISVTEAGFPVVVAVPARPSLSSVLSASPQSVWVSIACYGMFVGAGRSV